MKKFLQICSLFLCLGLLTSCASESEHTQEAVAVQKSSAPRPWADQINREVLSMGYGNWIVVGEASFPVHSRRGVRTLVVDGELPDVLDQVVTALEYSESVKPFFTTAKELPYVSNDRAPGIDELRLQMRESLHGHGTREMEYRSLGMLLESSSNKFAVLVLKTKTALPYSSVYIELHSNYWDADSERNLREQIEIKEGQKKS